MRFRVIAVAAAALVAGAIALPDAVRSASAQQQATIQAPLTRRSRVAPQCRRMMR